LSDLLPIVELLADASSHEERAAWLFACPLGVIHREHMAIRRLLQKTGLIAGVAYLESVLSMTNARRLPDGQFPYTIMLQVHVASQDLRGAVAAACEGVSGAA